MKLLILTILIVLSIFTNSASAEIKASIGMRTKHSDSLLTPAFNGEVGSDFLWLPISIGYAARNYRRFEKSLAKSTESKYADFTLFSFSDKKGKHDIYFTLGNGSISKQHVRNIRFRFHGFGVRSSKNYSSSINLYYKGGVYKEHSHNLINNIRESEFRPFLAVGIEFSY